MTSVKGRWFQAYILLAFMLFAFPVSAETMSKGDDNGHAETLLLDVTINTQPLPEIVRVEKLVDGRLALPLDAWQSASLRPPAGEPLALPDKQRGYTLESIPGLTYKLDRGQMTLAIMAPASAFTGNAINQGRSVTSPPNLAPPGFYLNYDASVNNGDYGFGSYGALVETVAFNKWGSVVTGLALRGNRKSDETVRTETFWRKDLPGPMETLVVGDTISNGGAWSRPARYAGIRWSRDFSLRPGFFTMPMPSLSGSAALPSTIDVLINNRLQQSERVNPGPFDLTNVPVTNGAGEINLIVRDLLGREAVVAQSYYLSPRLLAKGLTDFSLELGVLRENYGRKSNDYGDSFAAGTYRYGLTSAVTGETHIEIQPLRQAAGIDLVGLFGTLGVAETSVAISNADGIKGNHYLLGLERSTPNGGGSLRWEYFDHDFVQFASLPSETKPRERFSANLGIVMFKNISAGISYILQSSWEGDRFSMATANLGLTLPWDMHLNSYASRSWNNEHDWSCGVTLSLPLKNQRSTSVSTNRDSEGRTLNSVELSQSPPAGPGFGWRLRTSDDTNQQWQGAGTWNTNVGQLNAEASDTANNPVFRLGANGSVGLLGGHLFATRTIGSGSFAVVKIGDLADVPVYRSNQLVATTDTNGMALVPALLPYQENQLTIDPVELPFDIVIHGVKVTAVPFARSGLFVDIPVRRSRNALLLMHQADGTLVPVGARVTVLPGENEFLVGKRGEVYLMDLVDSNRLSVQWQGGSCHLDLPLDPKGPSEPRIGPLTCGGQP